VLGAAGFGSVLSVAQQARPDGSFPTVRSPNPEEPGALDLALAEAERVRADLVLATDPDADRLAVAARDGSGSLRLLSGNEVGALLGHYRLTQARERPRRPLVITSIVSSPLLGEIARDLGVRHEETLTGFKWIAARALELEAREGAAFVFGYEEALGYAIGTAVRDKDGIGAALAVADLAGWCRSRQVTVLDYLEDIERRHGFYLAAAANVALSGIEGAQRRTAIMKSLRKEVPHSIAGRRVSAVKDYLRGLWRQDGLERPLSSVAADVLIFALDDGSRIAVRPSGTEPKIKIYFDVEEPVAAGESLSDARSRGAARLERLRAAFLAEIERAQRA
jgi:phosphomannomutase